MTFVKERRTYFFRGNAPINPSVPDNKKDNLATEGVPSQDTMERLTASAIFFRERADRAMQSTGTENDENLVGHVQVETDANAKNWTSGLQSTVGAETTKVIHARQLAEVSQDEDITTTLGEITNDSNSPEATNIQTVAVTINPVQDQRNDFELRITAELATWANNLVTNLSSVNTTVYGTGGLDNPGENDTGLVGNVNVLNNIVLGGSGLAPIGIVQMWTAPTAPDASWLLCNGQEYLQSTYPDLFALIGTTFNTGGETAGHFRVPDMTSKFVAGYSGVGEYTLGNQAGADSVSLTPAQTAVKGHAHSDSFAVAAGTLAVGSTGSAHQHQMAFNDSPSAGTDAADITNTFETAVVKGWNGAHLWTGTVNDPGGDDSSLDGTNQGDFNADGSHTHNVTGSPSISGSVTALADGANGAAHENRPAYITLNHIIKALA